MTELCILRYNPETDGEPRFQSYEVPCREDWVVLDALNYIKENLDPTLSYRWSCHMAVCGSCGMMINQEPKLACKAFLRDYQGVIRVEPLRHFPIERDLVTVIDDFMAKHGDFFPENPENIEELLESIARRMAASAEGVITVTPPPYRFDLRIEEDLIEEVIGDINDEFDEIGSHYQKLDNRTYMFDGKTSMHDFCKILKVEGAVFNLAKSANKSVGGMLRQIHGSVPRTGEPVVVKPFTFIVEKMDNRRIKKVRVQVNDQ